MKSAAPALLSLTLSHYLCLSHFPLLHYFFSALAQDIRILMMYLSN